MNLKKLFDEVIPKMGLSGWVMVVAVSLLVLFFHGQSLE
jgi:hypothetical protein